MAKRKKTVVESGQLAGPGQRETAGKESSPPQNQSRPPEKQPTLLAVSLVLFALWFTFLLVTALGG